MATQAASELKDFGQFVLQLVAEGEAGLSPEQALLRWKLENLSPQERDEELQAIQEALDDMAAGDQGMPVDDFLRQLDAQLASRIASVPVPDAAWRSSGPFMALCFIGPPFTAGSRDLPV